MASIRGGGRSREVNFRKQAEELHRKLGVALDNRYTIDYEPLVKDTESALRVAYNEALERAAEIVLRSDSFLAAAMASAIRNEIVASKRAEK
jgi:hypothetical protein